MEEDLKEEIQRAYYDKSLYDADNLDRQDFDNIARHFANWQHGKDFDDLLQSEMDFPKEFYEKGKADAMKEMKEALQTEYEKGRFDMREEMLKDAQLGIIEERADGFLGWNTMFGTEIDYRNYLLSNFKNGDNVKIILIKEEQ